MRLLSTLVKLEGVARRSRRLALIWSKDEVRLGRPLVPGELLAVDLCAVVPSEAAGAEELARSHPVVIQSRERATRDPLDLGDVYDGAGAKIGLVYDVIAGPVPLVYWSDLASAPLMRSGIARGRGMMSGASGRR